MPVKPPLPRSRKKKKESSLSGALPPLPGVITLRAIGQEFDVIYSPGVSPRTTFSESGNGLTLSGSISRQGCAAVLKRWTSGKARSHFPAWLEQSSRELNLPYARVSLRKQRTRWASCSPGHTISINEKLLFVPALLVEYVFVHELCHTVELNHSRRFWALVAAFEPNYKALDRELRTAWRYVPWWMCKPGSGELNQSYYRKISVPSA